MHYVFEIGVSLKEKGYIPNNNGTYPLLILS
jgi:hypothetical protein